jgi:LPS-assembly lipoprotein
MNKTPTLVTSRTELPPEGAAVPRGGPSARRRQLLLLLTGATLTLSACGFALRQAPNYVFNTIFVGGGGSPLANDLRRNIAYSENLRVIPVGGPIDQAQVILDILMDQREKVVVGLNASGQVREFQLRNRVRFRLRTREGKELIPETELLQQRDISFSEAVALAKEAEEQLLYRDMQADIAQQLVRRLAAVKTL